MTDKTLPKWVTILFFIIGLISAFIFRAIIIIARFDTTLSRIAWYIAVVGYIAFFAYRFMISLKRRRMIERNRLIEKLQQNELDDNDRHHLEYILRSLMKSKEMYNYVFIFLLSGVAIVMDLSLVLFLNR
jgi:uncharacterized protein YacL